MNGPRQLTGLEQEEHPARQVSVAVRIEADVLDKTCDVERDAEDRL